MVVDDTWCRGGGGVVDLNRQSSKKYKHFLYLTFGSCTF